MSSQVLHDHWHDKTYHVKPKSITFGECVYNEDGSKFVSIKCKPLTYGGRESHYIVGLKKHRITLTHLQVLKHTALLTKCREHLTEKNIHLRQIVNHVFGNAIYVKVDEKFTIVKRFGKKVEFSLITNEITNKIRKNFIINVEGIYITKDNKSYIILKIVEVDLKKFI